MKSAAHPAPRKHFAPLRLMVSLSLAVFGNVFHNATTNLSSLVDPKIETNNAASMFVKALKRLAYYVGGFVVNPILQRLKKEPYHDAASQIQLQLTYRSLKESGRLPGIGQVGFKVFSQTDEDGILLYIFSVIGSITRKSVEICAGDGFECNTSNLIIMHGWHGLLVDGSEVNVKRGIAFYKEHPHTYISPPTFAQAWITRDNVNEVISRNGFEGEIDLLSVDMDGVDYWIWEAITGVAPRVVVVEYNHIIGPDRALSVPYSDTFNANAYPKTNGLANFYGASLPAFVKLARSKGYRFVGCNRYGYNAFFIRNSIGEKEIPEMAVKDCFGHPRVMWGMKERFPVVKDLPWVEV